MNNTKQPALAADDTRPLFYRDPVVLQFAEHPMAGLLRKPDLNFAAGATAIPVYAGEIAAAAMHYPIVFSDSDPAVPLAIVGIRAGQNLLIEANGAWRSGFYVPAYVRRYPFIAATGVPSSDHFLAVDRSSPRFRSDADQTDTDALFSIEGAPTDFARSAMQFCMSVVEDEKRTRRFTTALVECNLLTAKHATFQLPDQSRLSLDGFRLIDRDAYRRLPSATVAAWHAAGWLDLAVLHMASESNWSKLLQLNTEISHPRKIRQ